MRSSLPGVDGALIAGIDLQASHVAKVSERVVSAASFSAYYQAALDVAQAYTRSSAEAEACRTGTLDDCAQGVLQPAVTRLYRRAPTPQEWASSSATLQSLSATHDVKTSAAGVLAAALLTPQALFRTESGSSGDSNAVARLSPTEALDLASFALTGKAPDAALTRALGALGESDFWPALGNQAASWVSSPEFRERATDFAEIRFGVQHLPELSRSDPTFTPVLRGAFIGEFREFLGASLLAPGGTFADLFSKSPERVFPGLEAIYASDPPGRRKGVLGLASLLAARAAPNGSDPVKRGMMVRVELLCESVPPPIPGADFDQVMITDDMQTRERFEALAAIPTCTSCHQAINPPGYLFEEFDELGRHRSTEKGRPINATGTLPAPLGRDPYPGVGDWDGMVPLAEWLAQSPEARGCFAAHFVSYVLSEPIPEATHNCMLPALAARFLQSGRLDELTADLVSSELFQYRLRGAP